MQNEIIILTGVSGFQFQRAIGAYRISAYLREHGYSVQVIDFIDEFSCEELTNILDKCTGPSTLAVCVSTTFLKSEKKPTINDGQFGNIRKLTDNCRFSLENYKKQHKTVKIIGGGANIHWYKEDPIFDVIITGYGELAALEYIDGLKNNNKTIYPKCYNKELINGDTRLLDTSTIGITWHTNDCILDKESLPIEISRGCIFKCKFCSYPLNGKKKFDYIRDPMLIKKELLQNYKMFGTTNYMFGDDTFNDSTYKLEILHDVFTSLPFKIQFVAYLRLDLLYAHPEQIILLQQMGLKSAAFGIESLNPKTAKFIGKGLAKDKIKEFLPKLYHEIWGGNISILCSLIVGLPYESLDEIEESFEWFQSSGINSIWLPLAITPSNFYLSDIDINYAKYGYTLGPSIGEWKNNVTTRKAAEELAHRLNEAAQKQGTVNTWFLFWLLSCNLEDADTLQKLKWSEVNWAVYNAKTKEMVQQYKNMLYNCINSDVNLPGVS